MQSADSTDLFPAIATFISERRSEFSLIPHERRELLAQAAAYISSRLSEGKTARLTFICTHNSRRSQLSQVWAHVAADIFNLKVEAYSGGTEVTAFNPRAVDALRRAGLEISASDPKAANPIYHVRHAVTGPILTCFSKTYKETPNPTAEYCAVMTCSNADDACPIVSGCEHRLPIRYEDPKAADDTPKEEATYDERSNQICREMLFMMSQVTQ